MIPSTLKSLPQWVNWRYLERDGQATKIPFQPSGQAAKPNDPATWSTFDAVNVGGQFVGFVFAPGGGLFGIDLDNCLVKGELLPWAAEIVERFPGAYVEVSPSGNGVKLFCAGDYEGRGRKRKFGAGRQAVEVYGTGRYFAVTGEAIQAVEPTDCSDGLKWLLDKYWPASTAPKAVYTPPPTLAGNIERRAAGYLAKIEPTRCGTASCHDRTFHAAGVLYWGFAMDVSDALPLLISWAESGEHQWTVSELERKINQVAERGCDKPRGWALAELGEEKAVKIDWDNLKDSSGKKEGKDEQSPLVCKDIEDTEAAVNPGYLPDEFFSRLTGMIRDVYRFSIATSPRPQPEMCLLGAVALVAALAGRKVRTTSGLRTGIYLLGIAESGGGKDRPRKVNQDILTSDTRLEPWFGHQEFASAQGMEAAVSKHPAILFQLDEVARMFSAMNASGGKDKLMYELGGAMLKMYSSMDTVYKASAHAQSKNDILIRFPCPTIFSTNNQLVWNHITTDNVREGLLGRFLILEGRSKVRRRPRNELTRREPPKEVLEIAMKWAEFLPLANMPDGVGAPPIEIPFDDEASVRFEKHETEIEDKLDDEEGMRRAIWGRAAERTEKLSLIFAASRCGPGGGVISLDDVELAVQLSNHATRTLIYNLSSKVSDNQFETACKRLLSVIRDGMPRLTSLSSISRISGLRQSEYRDRVLKSLVEAEDITKYIVKVGSNETTCYGVCGWEHNGQVIVPKRRQKVEHTN